VTWKQGRSVIIARLSVTLAAIVGLTLAFYVMQGAVDSTPAVLPPARNDVVHVTRQIAPQGWAFFTKDAQSDFIVPFGVSAGELIDRSIAVGASAEWAFGFNRAGRSQGAEIASFLQGVGRAAWTRCTTAAACDAVVVGDPLDVENPLEQPTLCGEMLLVAEKPVPWEWRDLEAEPRLQEALHVDIAC
jgi:antimicrobial peptide system SdpA family protein